MYRTGQVDVQNDWVKWNRQREDIRQRRLQLPLRLDRLFLRPARGRGVDGALLGGDRLGDDLAGTRQDILISFASSLELSVFSSVSLQKNFDRMEHFKRQELVELQPAAEAVGRKDFRVHFF